MRISIEPFTIHKRFPLTISRGTTAQTTNIWVRVEHEGIEGWGEASPFSIQERQSTEVLLEALEAIAPQLEAFSPWAQQQIEQVLQEVAAPSAAWAAVDLAVHDWLGKRVGLPLWQLWGLNRHQIVPTSVTVGINDPIGAKQRVRDWRSLTGSGVLKIKLGSPAGIRADQEMLLAIREEAPQAELSVDANGGWSLDEAVKMCDWLALQGVRHVEQPLAAGKEADLPKLYARSPLPIFVDESCFTSRDIPQLADRVHGINIKLMKSGGLTEAIRMVHTARACGLQVMLGCYSDSTLANTAAAQLSPFADYVDLDSHLNLVDDSFRGQLCRKGVSCQTTYQDWGYNTMHLTRDRRVAILLHEGLRSAQGKTGLTLLRYSEATIVAVIDASCTGESLFELTGIAGDAPIVDSVASALAYHPDVLVIGIAPAGGGLPEVWWQEVKQAVAAGLSVVNGLHTPMASDPELQSLLKEGQVIWDIRQEPANLSIGSGKARSLGCKRLLTVGTDMGVGKMSASLELNQAAQRRGIRSKFLATGQAGIMISGDGIPLDAVRVDFAAGAVEQLVLRFGNDYDLVIVEGQGSLLHPGSTATLPLIRGTQPTGLVLVHRAGQAHIRHQDDVPIPPLPEVIKLYEAVAYAGGAFAPVQVVAIALNTGHLAPAAAQAAVEQVGSETGLPCTDAVRFGADLLLDAVMAG